MFYVKGIVKERLGYFFLMTLAFFQFVDYSVRSEHSDASPPETKWSWLYLYLYLYLLLHIVLLAQVLQSIHHILITRIYKHNKLFIKMSKTTAFKLVLLGISNTFVIIHTELIER